MDVTLCDTVKLNTSITDTGKLVTIHITVLNHYTIV